MRYTDSGVGWVGWMLMVMMMLTFWGAIASVVVTLIHQSNSRSWIGRPIGRLDHPNEVAPELLRILEERFARGDIDEDEFRRRHNVLRDGP